MAEVFLWDDSHWGDLPAARDGMSGYTHKLTDGNRYYEDPEYRPAMDAARRLGFPVLGPYHVLHGGVSVTEQARWFVARATALTPWWRDHPLWIWQIDAEPFDYLRRPSVGECNAFGAAIMRESGAPHNSVLGYLAAWSYGTAVRDLVFPFWHASYGSNPAVPYRQAYPGAASTRWIGGGRNADFLQYGSRCIVAGQSTSDASAFRGTLADLARFLRPGTPQPEPPQESDVVFFVIREKGPHKDMAGWYGGGTWQAANNVAELDVWLADAGNGGKPLVEVKHAEIDCNCGALDPATGKPHPPYTGRRIGRSIEDVRAKALAGGAGGTGPVTINVHEGTVTVDTVVGGIDVEPK